MAQGTLTHAVALKPASSKLYVDSPFIYWLLGSFVAHIMLRFFFISFVYRMIGAFLCGEQVVSNRHCSVEISCCLPHWFISY